MNEEQINHAMLFIMYSTLYMNDMVCNSILELECYIPKEDREAARIYSALKKRCRSYLNEMTRIYDTHNDFIADYNLVIDDAVDELVGNFEAELRKMLDANNVKDSYFLAKSEAARFMIETSIAMIDSMIYKMKVHSLEVKKFENSKLKEVRKILINFNKWIYRKVDVKISMTEDCDAYKALMKLQEGLCNYDNFDKAYKTAYANYKSI